MHDGHYLAILPNTIYNDKQNRVQITHHRECVRDASLSPKANSHCQYGIVLERHRGRGRGIVSAARAIPVEAFLFAFMVDTAFCRNHRTDVLLNRHVVCMRPHFDKQ
jgi:hypothetical protein